MSSVPTRLKMLCACADRFTLNTRLRGMGAERLWELLQTDAYVNALGAMTGNQAVQQVQAGLKAIYVSGWQVAADANNAGQMYPDQSLYPADSVPNLVPAHQQCVAARRPDPSCGRQGGAGRLVCPARGRCRGRASAAT